MDAETRAKAEAWVADEAVDPAARALLAIIRDRADEPTLISAAEAKARADMAYRENAARIDPLLAEWVMERAQLVDPA